MDIKREKASNEAAEKLTFLKYISGPKLKKTLFRSK